METKGIQQFLNSYSVKMIIVSGLAILLLIPSFLIQEVIRERIALSEKVKNELYAQWGGKQVVAGPVLNVPFSVTEPAVNNQGSNEQHGVAHFLPETLKTDGTLYPETRKRGIYKVVVYEGKLKLKGSFAQPDVSKLDLQNAQYNWDAAYFTIGVSDMRGIKNLPELVINGQKCKVEPGVAETDLFLSGITVKADSVDLKQPMNFEIELVINGSEDLSVEVLGKSSEVSMKSDWADPGFSGGFLPANHQVTAKGFTADWLVTHLNRNFPQQWIDNKYNTHDAKLGVELLIPVDHYQKSMRSAKYAILFIALNFIVFIFIELKSKARIHPFQIRWWFCIADVLCAAYFHRRTNRFQLGVFDFGGGSNFADFMVFFWHFAKWQDGGLGNGFTNRLVFVPVYHFAVAGLRAACRKHRTVYHSCHHHESFAAD